MSMQLISTVTVGAGGAANISFSSIPSDATDLLLLVSARSSWTGHDDLTVQINNNTSSIYSFKSLRGSGSGAVFQQFTNDTIIIAGQTTGTALTADVFSNASIYLSNYASSNTKPITSEAVNENNAATAFQTIMAGVVGTGSPISSIQLDTGNGGSFLQHSSASLYKITKA